MGRLSSRTVLVGLLVATALFVAFQTLRRADEPDTRSAGYDVRQSVRAAYFYNYMPVAHLDSLALAGFDRALVRWITDSLDAPRAAELVRWRARGAALGVEVVPTWSLQAPARLASLVPARRYTIGSGVESGVGCPLDSLFWRTAFLDRAFEALAIAPGTRRLAVDLEIYTSARLHHYDGGPCRCAPCLAEFRAAGGAAGVPDLAALIAWQEARLERIMTALLAEWAAAAPGVEIGIFDLDLASFVHRATARAFAAAGVPVSDYCERSYATGGTALPGARARLAALGLPHAPLIGGLWLRRHPPAALAAAVRSVIERADGYFIFTTYSLWQEPAKRTGPYQVPGEPAEYWRAFGALNGAS